MELLEKQLVEKDKQDRKASAIFGRSPQVMISLTAIKLIH